MFFFEFCSSFGDDLVELCLRPKRRRTSFFGERFCNVVFFLVHACDCFFRFLDFLGHFSGPIVASREMFITHVYHSGLFFASRMVVHVVISSWFGIVGSVFPSCAFLFGLSAIVSARIGHTRGIAKGFLPAIGFI